MCLLAGLANRSIAGHSAGRTRDAGLVPGAFATLDFPLTDVQVFHTDRGGGFDDTRIDELLDVFDIKRSLCFVKFLWAVSAFLLVRLSGCF